MAEHRADGIQVFGVVPEITQLFNSRYRLTFRCELGDNEEAWYYDNKENIFAEFGTLMDAGYGHTPATPDPESTWPNQRLISHELQYIPQKDVQVLTFIYETLTSTWTKEQEDVRGSTANGLRTLTRTQVAKIDTAAPYDEDDVGVATITDNGKTLYLAGFEDQSKADDQVQIGRFVTRWAEAGTLQTSKRNLSEGVVQVSTTFLAVEGSTVGPIISRSTQSVSGLKTITVTTLQDKNGNSIVDGGENLVNQYERKVDFTYPGVVTIRQDVLSSVAGIDPILFNYDLNPPVQGKVEAKVSVIFQTASEIVASDETYNDGSGPADSFWNPTEWARTYVSGIGWNYTAFSQTQGLRGYRVNPDVSQIITRDLVAGNVGLESRSGSDYNVIFINKSPSYIGKDSSSVDGSIFARVQGVSDNNGVEFTVNSRRLYASTPFVMEASGGPVDPSGNKYVLDLDLRPAFEDVDGNTYYKKTIITATV